MQLKYFVKLVGMVFGEVLPTGHVSQLGCNIAENLAIKLHSLSDHLKYCIYVVYVRKSGVNI